MNTYTTSAIDLSLPTPLKQEDGSGACNPSDENGGRMKPPSPSAPADRIG